MFFAFSSLIHNHITVCWVLGTCWLSVVAVSLVVTSKSLCGRQQQPFLVVQVACLCGCQCVFIPQALPNPLCAVALTTSPKHTQKKYTARQEGQGHVHVDH